MTLFHAVHKAGIVLTLAGFLILCILLVPVSGGAQAAKKMKVDKNQPIHIQSDRLDAYQEKKTVVFSGNAIATQGDKTIRADRLIIHYKSEPGSKKKKNTKEMEGVGDLEKIEAEGHVNVTQTGRIVTGDKATFYEDSQRVVMTGNAVMRDGKNVIKGDKIVVFLNEERGVVEGSDAKRVTATIYPNDKKDEAQKK